MGRLIGMVSALLAYFCVATVLAIAVLVAYGIATHALGSKQLEQMLAVVHGVDLAPAATTTGAAAETKKPEHPPLEIVAERRALAWREFERREKNVQETLNELKALQISLEREKDRFAKVAQSHSAALDEKEEKAKSEGRREFQSLVESMKPKQAKEQLLLKYKEGQVDVVVDSLRDMEEGKRAKILAEFKDPADATILAEVLERIRKSAKLPIIQKAREELGPTSPAAPNQP